MAALYVLIGILTNLGATAGGIILAFSGVEGGWSGFFRFAAGFGFYGLGLYLSFKVFRGRLFRINQIVGGILLAVVGGSAALLGIGGVISFVFFDGWFLRAVFGGFAIAIGYCLIQLSGFCFCGEQGFGWDL